MKYLLPIALLAGFMISGAAIAAKEGGGKGLEGRSSEKGASAGQREFRNNEKAVRAESDRQAKEANKEKYRDKTHDNRARVGKDGSVGVSPDGLNYKNTF